MSTKRTKAANLEVADFEVEVFCNGEPSTVEALRAAAAKSDEALNLEIPDEIKKEMRAAGVDPDEMVKMIRRVLGRDN